MLVTVIQYSVAVAVSPSNKQKSTIKLISTIKLY